MNNSTLYSISDQAVKKIQEIFHKDNELEKLAPQERLEARKKDIEPLVDAFFEWVKKHRDDVTRKSNTGKAFTYTIEQEQYLKTFLRDGDVPMDNNAAERTIRPFCIGKKNWVMCDTIHGAENSAIVYSLTETAKANDLRPYEYLKYHLTEITQHMSIWMIQIWHSWMICYHGLTHCRMLSENKTHNNDHAPLTRGACQGTFN